MLYLKYIGTGGTAFDYPVYEDQDNNLYFDTSFGNVDIPTLYTGAFVDCFGEIRGEPDKAILDTFKIAPEENTWEVASLFTEFPRLLGRVSFIQMYCKAHGKNIDLNSCWAVNDYLDIMKTEDYSLKQWFEDTCKLYPETFMN